MITVFNKKKAAGHLLALLTNIIWGTTFVSTKILLQELTPYEVLFYRFLLGYFFLWLLYPHREKPDSMRTEVLFALAGFSGICLNYLFENLALLYTQAANVSVLVSASPFLVGLFARLFYKQKLKPYFIPGFILAIVGISMICASGGSGYTLHFLGDMISLGAAFVWALYGIFSEAIHKAGDYNPIWVSRRLFFYGLLFIVPLYLRFRNPLNITVLQAPMILGNLLYLGIGACALSFVFWNQAIQSIGAVAANVYVYLLPVVTILASAFILKQEITGQIILGTVLTLAGLVMSELSGHKCKSCL